MRSSDREALARPAFWLALAALVINDHVLKGAEVLPAALTGKLSDIAGLVVAPILLSSILGGGRGRQGRRLLAFALVGGWFASINLMPMAASASVEAMAILGVDWTLWADPTDLLALFILPLTWHLLAQRKALSFPGLSKRLGMGFGLAACIATSAPFDPFWSTTGFVVNRTDEPIEIRLRSLRVAVDCEAIRDRSAELVRSAQFASGTVYTIDPHQALPLDPGLANGADQRFADPDALLNEGECQLAVISAEGLPEQLIFWDTVVRHDVFRTIDSDEEHPEGGLDLSSTDDGLVLEGRGNQYQVSPLASGSDTLASCTDHGQAEPIAWSNDFGLASTRVRATIDAIEVGIDGCLSLELTYGSTIRRPFICIPREDFPFEAGNEVDISVNENSLRFIRTLPVEVGAPWRVAELFLFRGQGGFNEGPFAVEVVDSDLDCTGGMALECGGIVTPGAGGIELGGGTRFVHPGDVMERDDLRLNRRAQMRIGRAENLIAAHPECGIGRENPGSYLEALVIYSEETR